MATVLSKMKLPKRVMRLMLYLFILEFETIFSPFPNETIFLMCRLLQEMHLGMFPWTGIRMIYILIMTSLRRRLPKNISETNLTLFLQLWITSRIGQFEDFSVYLYI